MIRWKQPDGKTYTFDNWSQVVDELKTWVEVEEVRDVPAYVEEELSSDEFVKEGSVDAEPTWESLVPLFCEWLAEGNQEQKLVARDHIQKMARVTDRLRQAQKKGLEYVPVNPPKKARKRAEEQ